MEWGRDLGTDASQCVAVGDLIENVHQQVVWTFQSALWVRYSAGNWPMSRECDGSHPLLVARRWARVRAQLMS